MQDQAAKPARTLNVLWSFRHTDGEQVVCLTARIPDHRGKVEVSDYEVRATGDDMEMRVSVEKKATGDRYTVVCSGAGKPQCCDCPARIKQCRHFSMVAALVRTGHIKGC